MAYEEQIMERLPFRLREQLRRANRRRKDRISLDELNNLSDPEIRKALQAATQKQDTRPAVVKVLDVLDIPRNIVANAIAGVTGAQPDPNQPRAAMGLPRVYMSDVLDKLGVAKGPARSILGFAGDVAIDPLTYATLGASTGTKLAQHLPRILPSGMRGIKAAARGATVSDDLARALVKRGGRNAKDVLQRLARTRGARGAVTDRAKDMTRAIQQSLVKRATRGDKAALAYFQKFGEKGRSLFRLPFAEKGFPVLGFGAKARRARAVEEGLSEAGGKAWDALRKTQAARRTAEAAKVGKSAEAAKLAQTAERLTERKKAAAVNETLQKLQGKFEVTPEAQENLRRMLMEKKRGAQKGLTANALKLAKERAAEAGAEASKLDEAARTAGEEAKAFLTSPDAPAVVQERMRAVMGPRSVRGAPGLRNQIQAVKRSIFGPARSEMWQRMTGARARHDMRSVFVAQKRAREMADQVEPVVRRLSADPKVRQALGGPDDVRRHLFALVEAGPNGQALGKFADDDIINDLFAKAQQAGLVDDQQVQQFLQQYRSGMEGVLGDMQRAGIRVSSIDDFDPRMMVPEARQAARIQEAHLGANPASQWPGGRLTSEQGQNLMRTRRVLFEAPEGERAWLLTSDPQFERKAKELADLGFEEADTKMISAAQWNEMSRNGELEKLLGPEREGLAAYAGPIFEEDPSKAYGYAFGRAERAKAGAQVRDLVAPYGVDVPREQALAGMEKFSHLAKPKMRPEPGSPFYDLIRTGAYDRMYPVPVADMLDNLQRTWNHPEAVNRLLRATDYTLGWWKTMQLYHPAYVLRNVFQNFVGGLMAGANPLAVAKITSDKKTHRLTRAMLGDDVAEGVMNLGGRDIGMDDLARIGMEHNLAGAGRTTQEIPRVGEQAMQVAKKRLGQGKDKLLGAVFRGNMFMENNQRVATWLHFIDRGMEPRDAAVRVLTAMPDLSDMSLWDRNLFRRVIPFWSWMRKNAPLQIMHHLPRRPAYAAMLPKLKNFVEAAAVDEKVPEEFRPEWMREQMAMQVTGDKGGGQTFLPMNWLPFEDLYAVGGLGVAPGESARRWMSAVRPEIRFGVELGTGENVFKEAPYEKGSKISTPDLLKAFPEALMGNSGTQMDSLLTLRPFREWAPGGRVSQMPTAAGKIGRVAMGGAFQPVSLVRGIQAESARLRGQAAQLRRKINYARSANDEALARDLQRQWIQTMKRLYEISGAGVPKATAQALEAVGVRPREY